ncbi:esterase [Photobacterium lutimaris]|uniref:Esterase n=1 Tax=Photobacterium lutimaris TaxID=388278 RepID=A0A2T3J291_9GAMM|nr:esterase [Photobacterium lutimaris]
MVILEERVIPYTSKDNMVLNLINVRGAKEAHQGPVILVHGAGVRANIFRPPVRRNLVHALVDHGYDVWLSNWRGSIDLPPNEWTLDQAACFDHPEAVKKIQAETGASKVKAIIHCQGSTSFTMSVLAGLLPQVETIISNAVSLFTIVPQWSRVKLKYAVPLVAELTPFISPAWGDNPPTVFAKLIRAMVKMGHHECDNDVCKMVSFTYGAGCPALWRHKNINEQTHEWVRKEFADVPLSFFKQMARCVHRGNLISYDPIVSGLPLDFSVHKPQTDARFIFYTGKLNRCFLPESQIRAFKFFDKLRPNYHALEVLEHYSHLDIFIGERADKDIFPKMLAYLDGKI